MSPPNLIFLSVDGLQAGMLGPYGNAWVRTPALNHLAAQSTLFDFAFAVDSSHDVILHSLWPSDLFGNRHATLLTDEATAEAHPSACIFHDTKFYEPLEEQLSACAVEDTELGVLLGQSAEWIAQAKQPFALWIHSRGMYGGWDSPYELREQFADAEDPPPPEFATPPELRLSTGYDPDELLGIQQAYAGQVAVFDECLGALLTAIDESPHAKNTVFALVGIRGFPLGEHLRVGLCDAALYNELTHVPLLIRRPHGVGALTRNSSLITHADLPSLIAGETPRARDHLRFRSQDDRAIRTSAWYLRVSGVNQSEQTELYAKPGDRWEVNDVGNRCSDIAAQLTQVLTDPDCAEAQPLPESLVTAID